MSIEMGLYSCKICNKNYSSYKTLWTHNKNIHNDNILKNSNNSQNILKNSNITKKYNCRICNKIFINIKTRWAHEKKCKIIESNKIELLESQIKELREIINNKNTTTTNNNTNNTNNGTIINNNTTNIKVSFCEEDVDKLSKKDKKTILNSGFMSLIKIIELMNLNKDLPEFQTIKIHNLKDKYAKVYDDNIKDYTTISKKDSLDSLICHRTMDLKSIYDELHKKDNHLHNCVLKLIDKIESYTPDTDDKKILDFYRNLTDEIILMIYNKTKHLENML